MKKKRKRNFITNTEKQSKNYKIRKGRGKEGEKEKEEKNNESLKETGGEGNTKESGKNAKQSEGGLVYHLFAFLPTVVYLYLRTI